MIGIVTAAYGYSPDDFIRRNKEVFEEYAVKLVIVTDKEYAVEKPWITILKFPVVMEPKNFNFSACLNYGIRHAIEKFGCDVIAITCIDIMFSNAALWDVKVSVNEGQGVDTFFSWADNENNAKMGAVNNVSHAGCFALTASNWEKLCAYNEKMYGWGWEDTDLNDRAEKIIKIKHNYDVPLFHINHDKRKTENRNDINLRIANEKWQNPNWGRAAI